MNDELTKLIDKLIITKENEVIEFKEAKITYDFDKLGQYFSALSNEANLLQQKYAWLLFGIQDNGTIVGTQYKKSGKLQDIKNDIATHTTCRITFIKIHERSYCEKRIVLFQIPAAPRGIPIAWMGHYYGRNGESIQALNLEKIERIRQPGQQKDWSAEICERATINDLAPEALLFARDKFKIKYPNLAKEIDKWDDLTFLNKAKITVQNKITNTAIILLGKDTSQSLITPAITGITWILKDKDNRELDYQHFFMPFIINAEKSTQKIRNLTYRYLPDNTLFPIEVTQYEPYVIREALYNCIAHQDYALHQRINLVEYPEYLILENGGSFIPETIANVFKQDAPQRHYRNKFLCDAMVALNMIDTIGSGIKTMFTYQRDRSFPLPDYEFVNNASVKVRIYGKIIDKNYTNLLLKQPNLAIDTILILDKVQKKNPISDLEAKKLKSLHLIEGRKPNYFISSRITETATEKANYIKNRPFNDEHYKKLILNYLDKFSTASRTEIEVLIMDKLSNTLNDKQKKTKINNLLASLKNNKLIINKGSKKLSLWEKLHNN